MYDIYSTAPIKERTELIKRLWNKLRQARQERDAAYKELEAVRKQLEQLRGEHI